MPAHRSLLALVAVLLAGSTHAETLTFQHGDGGAYSETLSATIGTETDVHHGAHFLLSVVTRDFQALLRFPDIIGENPGQIPPGSTIVSATLSLTMYNLLEASAQNAIHVVYAPWDESVTGNSFYGTPGVLVGPPVGLIPLADAGEVTSADITAIVQDWTDGDANHGIMLRNDADPAQAYYITRYYSDDAQEPSARPKLSVEFTPPWVAVESTTWGKVKSLYR